MGAIVSDFVDLPQDNDANRARLFAGVYADLASLGIAIPAQPADAITRAALLAHLQAAAGALIKAELANDPDSRAYTGVNAADAAALVADYVPGGVARFPGSNLTGYKVAAGSTDTGLVLVQNPGGGAPALDTISGLANGLIRFRLLAGQVATVANRGAVMTIKAVPSATTLTLDAPLPAIPAVNDVLDFGLVRPGRQPGRLNQILARLPYAPNALTPADVAGAKV